MLQSNPFGVEHVPGLIEETLPVHVIQGDLVDVTARRFTGTVGYIATWTRTKSVDPEEMANRPTLGLPVDPDVYVISLYHPTGAVFDNQVWVLGYRKMNLNDAIAVKNDLFEPGIDYEVIAVRPGTFPTDWFQTRPDPVGEVGGYMFNNEIPTDTWEPWQDQEDDEENIYNYDEEMFLRAPSIGQGASATLTYLQWAQGSESDVGDLVEAEETSRRIVKGVKVGKDGLELVSGEEAIANENGANPTPVFLVQGAERSTPPPISIPD